MCCGLHGVYSVCCGEGLHRVYEMCCGLHGVYSVCCGVGLHRVYEMCRGLHGVYSVCCGVDRVYEMCCGLHGVYSVCCGVDRVYEMCCGLHGVYSVYCGLHRVCCTASVPFRLTCHVDDGRLLLVPPRSCQQLQALRQENNTLSLHYATTPLFTCMSIRRGWENVTLVRKETLTVCNTLVKPRARFTILANHYNIIEFYQCYP